MVSCSSRVGRMTVSRGRWPPGSRASWGSASGLSTGIRLTAVSTFSSNLGAVQNRFQSTIATLGAQQTNLTASQSSIQDTDFAAETAKLSQSQVLQQAGISVLATANSQSQSILKLLQ